ncbi:MAG: hypothetical protein QOH21_2967 [Acidobacteriota bacterium]|jgi:hypothetical protein|nr:hypothetical protein [Acidobacteriota bacterium]
MSKRIYAMMMAFALAVTAPMALAQDAKKADAAAKAPRLTLVEPVKDFGTVPKGQKLDWSFMVKNTGDADLEIIAARPTCGCTVADFDKVIKPGQTGKVTAHVDTTNFAGPIAKAVTLETNDPAAPSAQITIHAVVKPYVEAYPAGFVRFNILQGDVEKQTVTLYSEETDPFDIVKIESPAEWIKVDKKKIEGAEIVPNVGRPGQNQYRFDVTVGGPDAKVGPLAEKIHVVTNSKNQPDYYVSVTGVVRPPFRVEPTGVNFGEVAPNDTAATRTVTVRSNNAKTPESFSVTRTESDVPGVTAEFKPTANKGEYEVTLQVAKTAKPGAIDGNVKIYTSDKVNPIVTVPVKGVVKSAS